MWSAGFVICNLRARPFRIGSKLVSPKKYSPQTSAIQGSATANRPACTHCCIRALGVSMIHGQRSWRIEALRRDSLELKPTHDAIVQVRKFTHGVSSSVVSVRPQSWLLGRDITCTEYTGGWRGIAASWGRFNVLPSSSRPVSGLLITHCQL